MARQLANAMKAEGYAFTVFTPGNGLRLAADRGRDDFIELALDTTGDRPEVMARIRHQRGSRTLDEEVPVKRGADSRRDQRGRRSSIFCWARSSPGSSD